MADEKQYISRIRLADGTTVDIKDQEARSELNGIAALVQGNSGKVDALTSSVNDNTIAISAIQQSISAIVQPKASKEISVATDGALGIKELDVSKLVQTDGDTFILNGGEAV